MKRLFRDTLFLRLFALVLGSMIVSQIITTSLFFAFHDGRQPPSRVDPAGQANAQPMLPNGPRAEPPRMIAPPDQRLPRWDPPPQQRSPTPLLIALGVQFIALSIAAWLGARVLARPVQDLAHASGVLANNLDAPPVPAVGPVEAQEAAHAFNRMQARIRAQMDERTRFLAAVSHDLRTPLTRMKLRAEQVGDEAIRTPLRADIDEMNAMLNATLDFLRGSAQTEAWQTLDIQALLEAIVEDARDEGHDIALSGSAAPISALPTSLRRCLDNLVNNALRYGHRADITLREASDGVMIDIADAGPGIPENQMSAVFEPFVRLEASRNKNTGGVGLGLSIARDAVRRHGGALTLHNAPTGGLIARVWLPRTP